MKVRPIIAARATAGAMLMAVTVAACTGGTPSSTAPSIFTPQPATQSASAHASDAPRTPAVGQATPTPPAKASASASASDKAAGKATSSAKPKPKATAKPKPKPTVKKTPDSHRATASPAPTPVPSASRFPDGAPQTGGGGTAGLQDGLLFEIGGAAILAGLGSLTYRRRLRRKHRADTPDRTDTPARTGIR